MSNKYQFCAVLRKIPQITLTIAPTPEEAKVKLNGVEQSSITVAKGDAVDFEISKTGYCTKTGTIRANSSTTVPVELNTTCEIIICVRNDNATTTIQNGESATETFTERVITKTVAAGSNTTITVSKEGYTSHTFTIENISRNHQRIVILKSASEQGGSDEQ